METETRELTPEESAVLGLLLSVDFPGVLQLRLQAASATVVGGCDCGCPSIALAVSPQAPRASAIGYRLVPAEGVVSHTQDGPPQEIILFVDDGRLSYMELVYHGTVPARWPALDRIDVSVLPR